MMTWMEDDEDEENEGEALFEVEVIGFWQNKLRNNKQQEGGRNVWMDGGAKIVLILQTFNFKLNGKAEVDTEFEIQIKGIVKATIQTTEEENQQTHKE